MTYLYESTKLYLSAAVDWHKLSDELSDIFINEYLNNTIHLKRAALTKWRKHDINTDIHDINRQTFTRNGVNRTLILYYSSS